MQDLERVRYVTGNYERLQGLKYVPLTVWLATMGIVGAFLVEPPSGFFDLALAYNLCFLVGSIVAIALCFRAAGYYDRRFGRVEERRRHGGSGRGIVLFAGVAVAGVSVSPLTNQLGEPVTGFFAGCLLAAFILHLWWERRHRLALHWPVLAALAVIVGSVPAVGTLPGHGISLLCVPMGSLLAAGLLFDHLLLVRTFKSVPDEGHPTTRA